MSNREIALYLYCLTPTECAVPASAMGVDGEGSVSVRACGGIGAVLSEVALGEFCGETAEARLQDLAWLGPRACRHAAVIEEVMRQGPVLPARFATLFTSFDSLHQAVTEGRGSIAGFFDQLSDKQEWAVKGLLDRAGALRRLGSSAQPSATEAPAPAASPGARYFQQKRIQAEVERDFKSRLKEFCRRAAAALGASADGFRERRTLGAVAGETDAEVVLNWAFLVSPAALEDFRAQVDRFNAEEAFPGLLLTLTGPWPPYTFAPDLSGGAQE